jgi:hypothetical protein
MIITPTIIPPITKMTVSAQNTTYFQNYLNASSTSPVTFAFPVAAKYSPKTTNVTIGDILKPNTRCSAKK